MTANAELPAAVPSDRGGKGLAYAAIVAGLVLAAGAGWVAWDRYWPIHKAKQTVRDRLKDPESAVFDNLTYNPATRAVCGTVNAKNSLGGYVGAREFIAVHKGLVHFDESADRRSSETTAEAIAKLEKRLEWARKVEAECLH